MFVSAVPPRGVLIRRPGEAAQVEAVLPGAAGEVLELECAAAGGSPQPSLHWWVGDRRLEAAEVIIMLIIFYDNNNYAITIIGNRAAGRDRVQAEVHRHAAARGRAGALRGGAQRPRHQHGGRGQARHSV